MKPTTQSPARPRAHRRRKASVMVEFAMLLPIFFLFVLFSIDAGRMILLRSQLQDATQQAARAGAQVGGGGSGSSSASATAFYRAIDLAPGMDREEVSSVQVLSGRRCTNTSADSFVTVQARYATSLVTPGLGTLIGMLDDSGRGPEGQWQLSATSVARCEVVR